jgi:hypothetical protein
LVRLFVRHLDGLNVWDLDLNLVWDLLGVRDLDWDMVVFLNVVRFLHSVFLDLMLLLVCLVWLLNSVLLCGLVVFDSLVRFLGLVFFSGLVFLFGLVLFGGLILFPDLEGLLNMVWLLLVVELVNEVIFVVMVWLELLMSELLLFSVDPVLGVSVLVVITFGNLGVGVFVTSVVALSVVDVLSGVVLTFAVVVVEVV